jgi:hypothetical protein
VQRVITEALSPAGQGRLLPMATARQLAWRASSRPSPSEADLSAVRRALRGLAAAGTVEAVRWKDSRDAWQGEVLRYRLTQDAARDIRRARRAAAPDAALDASWKDAAVWEA